MKSVSVVTLSMQIIMNKKNVYFGLSSSIAPIKWEKMHLCECRATTVPHAR